MGNYLLPEKTLGMFSHLLPEKTVWPIELTIWKNHSPYLRFFPDFLGDWLCVFQLLNVVSHLAKQNLQVLVLGRKHMLTQNSRWRRVEMEKMQKQASFFFADNM